MSIRIVHLVLGLSGVTPKTQPLPRPHGLPAMAAALVSRHQGHRELLVVVDPEHETINVKLFTGRLEAEGDARCSIRGPDARGATVVAQVELDPIPEPGVDGDPAEILAANLAVTWALVRHPSRVTLDVAGTAFVFHPGQLRPEEFRARADHPFNRFPDDTPEVRPAPTRVSQPLRRTLPGLSGTPRLVPRWVSAATRPRLESA